MKSRILKFLLLLSLAFNILHASVIALEDKCAHETATEYVLEQNQGTNCGDLCDMHHLFHFMAIIANTEIIFDIVPTRKFVKEKLTLYTPPFKKTSIKPPIA